MPRQPALPLQPSDGLRSTPRKPLNPRFQGTWDGHPDGCKMKSCEVAVAFTTFVEAFLDGFTFPGVFTRARRPGAPTQVFASDEVEPLEAVKLFQLQQLGQEKIAAAKAAIESAVAHGEAVARGKAAARKFQDASVGKPAADAEAASASTPKSRF
jgi:hypothetical protein